MNKIYLLMLFLFVALFNYAYAADDLMLHCRGSGYKTEMETTNISSGLGSSDRKFSTVNSKSKRDFSGSADVKIGMGIARLHPPSEMVPKISDVDDEGWISIDELNTTEQQISGKVRFNLFNKPTVNINRLTGEINISSSKSSFTGECEAVDLNAKPKF